MINLIKKQNSILVFILTIGVFGILTTEMGIVGILPLIADTFHVSVAKAGLLVSLFALGVAISGPIMPLLFSGINRKVVMLMVLGVFVIGNVVSMMTSNFTILLIARIIPAFFHPIYCSLALTVAASSVSKEEAPKAISKVMLGVNAGMILGVPITSYIANETSIEIAMLCFSAINMLAFIATLLFIPSMPVSEKHSYGTQVSVLKKPLVWVSIVAIICVGSAVASVSSFIAEYLETVTNISGKALSLALFFFGLASLVGNLIGGRLLSKNALKTITVFPLVLGGIYILSFLTGESNGLMMLTILLLGMLFAVGSMSNQYMIASAAPEAPDFANGLFLACSNLGITIGTAIGWLFISGLGTQYIVVGGLLFLVLSFISILLRNYLVNPTKKSVVNELNNEV